MIPQAEVSKRGRLLYVEAIAFHTFGGDMGNSVRRLPVARVRVGKKLLYRAGDIQAFIAEHTEVPAKVKGATAYDRVPQGLPAVGFSVLPSKQMLQKIRLGYAGGGKAGGTRGTH